MTPIDLLFPADAVKLLTHHFGIASFFQMLFSTSAVLSRRAALLIMSRYGKLSFVTNKIIEYLCLDRLELALIWSVINRSCRSRSECGQAPD